MGTYMGVGSEPRVGLGRCQTELSAIAGRVGSIQRFAGSGRVGSGPRKVTRGHSGVCRGDLG